MIKPEVHLYYLAEANYGGWVTYTAHLYMSFAESGYAPKLFCIGSRSEMTTRDYGAGLQYQNLSLSDAVAQIKNTPSLITAVDKNSAMQASALCESDCPIVIHDTAEMKQPLLGVAKCGQKVISIRKCNVKNLKELGVESEYVPHPYVPMFSSVRKKTKRAASISRLDWDKHTEIIVEANKILGEENKIDIWGSENRMFTHHALDSLGDWRINYKGRFPNELGAGAAVAANYVYIVDMSSIAMDGDGTQYTFLEAWDAGCILVVNKDWVRSGDGVVRHRETAIVVSGHENLASVISAEPDMAIAEASREILGQHSFDKIIPQLETALGWK